MLLVASEVSMKYRVYFTVKNSYCVDIDAEDEDEAWEIVRDEIATDDDAYHWEREWYDGDNYIEEVKQIENVQNLVH